VLHQALDDLRSPDILRFVTLLSGWCSVMVRCGLSAWTYHRVIRMMYEADTGCRMAKTKQKARRVRPGEALHSVTNSMTPGELERFKKEMERRWLDYLKTCEVAARDKEVKSE